MAGLWRRLHLAGLLTEVLTAQEAAGGCGWLCLCVGGRGGGGVSQYCRRQWWVVDGVECFCLERASSSVTGWGTQVVVLCGSMAGTPGFNHPMLS
jgi:hypothetical protein